MKVFPFKEFAFKIFHNKGDVKLNMIDSVHQNLFEGTHSIKKMSNPSISLFPIFLYKKHINMWNHCNALLHTNAHENICDGEVDDVHVGDGLHLLVGQHRHQHQKISADTDLVANIKFHHHPWQLPGIVKMRAISFIRMICGNTILRYYKSEQSSIPRR